MDKRELTRCIDAIVRTLSRYKLCSSAKADTRASRSARPTPCGSVDEKRKIAGNETTGDFHDWSETWAPPAVDLLKRRTYPVSSDCTILAVGKRWPSNNK